MPARLAAAVVMRRARCGGHHGFAAVGHAEVAPAAPTPHPMHVPAHSAPAPNAIPRPVSAHAAAPTIAPDAAPRLARAGLLTGLTDGLFSSILSVAFYHSTVTRLFQGVASTLLGEAALRGGTTTALVGLAMHVGVAFGWSALFLLAYERSAALRARVAARGGVVRVAAVYGPLVWLVMSLVVIPLLVHRPPTITARWWVQLIGHFPFVGLPIVWAIARRGRA